MKGRIIINSQLRMNYTGEMEKAMQGAHGIGYAVYSSNHEARMEVEQRREEDYLRSQRMIADLERKVHS